jgi:hypothetical protein
VVAVAVGVRVLVAVGDGVLVNVAVGGVTPARVAVAVAVCTRVLVGARVGVAVAVGRGMGVCVGSRLVDRMSVKGDKLDTSPCTAPFAVSIEVVRSTQMPFSWCSSRSWYGSAPSSAAVLNGRATSTGPVNAAVEVRS